MRRMLHFHICICMLVYKIIRNIMTAKFHITVPDFPNMLPDLHADSPTTVVPDFHHANISNQCLPLDLVWDGPGPLI